MPLIKFQKNNNLFTINKRHIKRLSAKAAIVILFLLFGCGGGGGGGSSDSGSGSGSVGSATLTWSAPTTNADGSPLTDLKGYKIHYGTSAGSYSATISVGNTTNYTVTNLQNGVRYYFAVTAYDINGKESGYSNEAVKTI